eukprot:CAMPEP_0174336664 /NCGR_PEP_ID=MMETSP0810-20121108/21715_1 /TAXON_ID=73025 ORGANISM="Eutreptiella gymnastica-like, Strain CCMP1594" /NCGR_SAMPLE_ID=MMETSP0810 /ASSEMBLY_ACC=CAM_ASM_000659 /LENGTH=136 /DNA_ID=CAMNT_0015455681 /DNA_START=315 /DNA_END=725 /DNA_ORIENTATION=-
MGDLSNLHICKGTGQKDNTNWAPCRLQYLDASKTPTCWDKLDDFFGSTQMKTVMDGLTLPATNDMGPGPAHIERQTSDHTLQHLWTGPQLTAASITWEPCDPAWGCLEQNFGTDAAMRWETVLGVIKKLFSQVPDD